MLYAVQPKYKAINRQQKRAIDKYYLKVRLVFNEVENQFLNAVFTAPAEVDYNTLYEVYLELWQEQEKRLRVLGWLKHLKINTSYFVGRYYPVATKRANYVYN